MREASLRLGIAPALQFSGMEVAVPDDVEAALRGVLRRGLTDVGQQTADVEVRVTATADRLTAQVTGYGTEDHGGDAPVEPAAAGDPRDVDRPAPGPARRARSPTDRGCAGSATVGRRWRAAQLTVPAGST